MAQYLVKLDIEQIDPLLPINGLVRVVRETILPSLEALTELQAQGKVVTGGYPVGNRHMVFVVEADSEEELHEVLGELPCFSGAGHIDARRLRTFEELRKPDDPVP